jgi:hypothetical protein
MENVEDVVLVNEYALAPSVTTIPETASFDLMLKFTGALLNFREAESSQVRTCKKFCVNGYTTTRRKYGLFKRSPGSGRAHYEVFQESCR